MDWLRWWHGTIADPKFGTVAKKAQVPRGFVLAVWAALLERASDVTQGDASVTRGDVTGFDCDDHDTHFDMPEGSSCRIFDAMVEKGLIVDGKIARWDERQPKREDSSADRMARMRERQRLAAEEAAKNGEKVTQSDAHVTHGDGKRRVDKKSKPKPSSSSGDDGFAEFWEIYPHKVGKQDARKAWTKLKVDADLLPTILAAVEAQKQGQAWRREDGEFIPHPATWLNGGRWLDVVRPYVERVNGDWMRDKEAMEAKGRSLTPPIVPLVGDTIGTFKNRILAALEASGQPERRQEPTPYVPPEPAGGVDNLTPEQRRARMQEMKALLAAGKNVGALPAEE